MNGISFWLGFAVLVALTAAGLRYYLPLARAVLVQGRGLVGVEWVGRIDAVLALALAAWFLLLGRQALLAGGEAKLDFQDVVTGAFLYAGIVLFLLGVWFYSNLAPARNTPGRVPIGRPRWRDFSSSPDRLVALRGGLRSAAPPWSSASSPGGNAATAASSTRSSSG